jgi:hypothetical protein
MNFILSATAVTFWAAYDVHVGSLSSRWSSRPATYRSLGRMRLSGRKMTASPIKGLYTLSILTFESYPTHLGWFLFRIVVYCTVLYHPLCLRPITVLPYFYIFLTGLSFLSIWEGGLGVLVFYFIILKNYKYILTNFNTFNTLPHVTSHIIRCTVSRE